MKAKEIMTSSPCCGAPTDTVQQIAQLMRDNDCGAVPIVDNGFVVGIVTDRDLAVRGIADGKSADTKVSDLMSASPFCCSPDDDVSDVERIMTDKQVRRVPIVDADSHCVGIISQADLARASAGDTGITDRDIGAIVEAISEPRN